MLAGQLSDAGLRVDFPPPPEQRGVGHEIVHVLMRIESDVEAGVVGGVALATSSASSERSKSDTQASTPMPSRPTTSSQP
jgi:hypothetical protein